MKFDTKAVVKSSLTSAAASFPCLASWVHALDEHERIELERKLGRSWEAFKIEVGHNQEKIAELNQSIGSVQESLGLLERTVAHVRAEMSEVKQPLFAKVFVNLILNSTITRDEKLTILDAVDELTETDLNVLHRFKEGLLKVGDQPEARLREKLGRELIPSLAKLEARGIIGRTAGGGVEGWSGDRDEWFNDWNLRWYTLLPFGETLVAALETG